jgi:hypothetical protein
VTAPPSTRFASRPDAFRPESQTAGGARLDPLLRRFLVWSTILITSGYSFLDYWEYSRSSHAAGVSEWDLLLAGRGLAPAQYRIGVLKTAALLARLGHAQLRHAFAAIDFLCLGVSLALLLWLLTRMQSFRQSSRVAQWLQASMALGCFLLSLLWSFWYQKPETFTTLLLLVLSAAAAQWRQRRAAAAVLLIVLAALGATVRADAMVAFHLGFLAVCLLPQVRIPPLGRAVQVAASVIALAAAVAVQWVIMHRLYPHAVRQVAAFQLLRNLTSWANYLVLACSLFPWAMTLWLAAKRWRALDGWSAALLLGSLAHFALFFTLGLSGEVRIFLPYAMTLVPLTVTLAAQRIEQTPSSPARAA